MEFPGDLFPVELAEAQAELAAAHPYEPREPEYPWPELADTFDDEERFGELPERIDPQTGYVED